MVDDAFERGCLELLCHLSDSCFCTVFASYGLVDIGAKDGFGPTQFRSESASAEALLWKASTGYLYWSIETVGPPSKLETRSRNAVRVRA